MVCVLNGGGALFGKNHACLAASKFAWFGVVTKVLIAVKGNSKFNLFWFLCLLLEVISKYSP